MLSDQDKIFINKKIEEGLDDYIVMATFFIVEKI